MTESKDPIRLRASQTAEAGDMLGRAFMADPAYTTLFPERTERERALRRMFRGVVGYTLVYGVVHTTTAVEGAACWLSPGNTELTLWRMVRAGLGLLRAVGTFDSGARRNFMAVLAHFDGIHNREVTGPHWYLWALGVEPECQGRGIGGRLLQPALAQADADGVLCYLETESERNVGFYQRRGFEVVHEGIVPDLGFTMWAMLREPTQ
jgi:ribosomal protein S18 acetylase RimI-like enzyme